MRPESQSNSDIASLLETARRHLQAGRRENVEVTCKQIERKCNQLLKKNPDQSQALRLYVNAYNSIAAIYQGLGKNIEANNALIKALSINPRFVPALNNQGLLFLEINKLYEAEERFRSVIEIAPEHVEARNNLGSVLQLTGRTDEAVSCYEKALEINPGYLQAYYNLGVIHAHKKEMDKAIHYYQLALNIDHKYFDALLNLGIALHQTGDSEGALVKLHEASAANPRNPSTFLQLGAIARACGKLEDALKYYGLAVQLDTQCHEACYQLGIIYYEQKKYIDAIKACVKTIVCKPDFPEAHNMLGVIYSEIRRFDEAEKAYKNAINLKPDYAEAHNNLWAIYRTRGDRDAAIKSCEKALSINPHLSHAHINLANSRHYAKDNLEHANLMHKLLEQTDLPVENRMHYHFALGKIYNDTGLYEKAFFHYEIANKLKSSQLHYDARKYSEYVSRIISVFTEDFLAAHALYGVPSDRPIFIVGMPRSGTTLVEQIITSHPGACAGGELPFIHHFEDLVATRLQSSLTYPEAINDIDAETTQILAKDYLRAVQYISTTAERITDKMPNNFLSIGFIRLLFSNARIIHCMRDPVDTCLSIYSLLFSKANEYAYDIETLGLYYLDYKRLMDHWRSMRSINMFEIQYEELVSNQERLSRELVQYVGLEWDDKCLSFYEKQGYVRTASTDQVRRPIYTSSIGRWKKYEPYLARLIEIIKSATAS